MMYRSEIDGLRAAAVVPVIFFHAGFSTFSGGFVGVDVFFVISGYLITTIILADMEQGRFSLVDFYERRARRILPGLFLVMIFSLCVAWFILLPEDMRGFSKSLAAVSLFSSNFLFWLESGYWDTASELKPLLHTWSLAVEEQYYVLFPLFLMLLWRYRKRLILGSFVLVAGVSLAVAQWGVHQAPSATFYLLPARGWELAIGASIAFFILYRRPGVSLISCKPVNEALGLLGLLMIGYGVFAFDERTPFPGFNALLPTVGTGLVILFSSPQTLAGRLLSSRPVVAVGLISYSAYLWHQPLLAFAKHYAMTQPGKLVCLALAALSFALAYLTWRFVEKPFRRKTHGLSSRVIFFLAVVGAAAFLVVGVAGYLTEGFGGRYSDDQRALFEFQDYERRDAYREGRCFLEPEQEYSDFAAECFASATGGWADVLWGDSHAGALSYGLRNSLGNLTQLTASGCMPIVGFLAARRPYCTAINAHVLARIGELQPGRLFLHANWSRPLGDIEGGLPEGLSRTIAQVRSVSPGTTVVVIGGVPQWPPSLPILLVKRGFGLRHPAYVASGNYEAVRAVDEKLSLAAKDNHATFISLLDLFCRNRACLSSVERDGTYEPFAWDYGHLTKSSSLLVAERLLLQLDQPRP